MLLGEESIAQGSLFYLKPSGVKNRDAFKELLIRVLRYSVQVPLKIGSCEQVRRISTRSAFDPKFFVSWPDPR
jgi:hypothetical protein